MIFQEAGKFRAGIEIDYRDMFENSQLRSTLSKKHWKRPHVWGMCSLTSSSLVKVKPSVKPEMTQIKLRILKKDCLSEVMVLSVQPFNFKKV